MRVLLWIVFYGGQWADASLTASLTLRSSGGAGNAGQSSTNFNSAREQQQCGCCGAFPCEWIGDALLSFHGSWNRDMPTGYKVVRIPFDNGAPVAVPSARDGATFDILTHSGTTAKWPNGLRPVDVKFSTTGQLLVGL